MPTTSENILLRDDTFFGVCEALGEDLGINSNLIRVALALLLFFSPVAAIIAYVGTGLVMAAIRWMVPNPRTAQVAEVETIEEPEQRSFELENLAVAA